MEFEISEPLPGSLRPANQGDAGIFRRQHRHTRPDDAVHIPEQEQG